ncbi:hypothetical protein BKA65DRAFT_486050 [Rhexocercosporidium sp. MPI-PUGE-AT-0058]|nr:hypothetical protein BKA65DRAFT_486050 [Rhexocercosporidium sp. MPI-PUGE-AT-0058]
MADSDLLRETIRIWQELIENLAFGVPPEEWEEDDQEVKLGPCPAETQEGTTNAGPSSERLGDSVKPSHDEVDSRKKKNGPLPRMSCKKKLLHDDGGSGNRLGDMLGPDGIKVFRDFTLRALSAFKILCPELPFTQRPSMDPDVDRGNMAFLQQWLFFGTIIKAFEAVDLEIDVELYISKDPPPKLTTRHLLEDLARWKNVESYSSEYL